MRTFVPPPICPPDNRPKCETGAVCGSAPLRCARYLFERGAYRLPAPIFGVAVWFALWAGGCGSAPTLPAVEITEAHISGSASVEGTVGAVPWGLYAEGDETGGKVCVSVWIWERCEVVER